MDNSNFIRACEENDITNVNKLIEESGSKVLSFINYKPYLGNTPLGIAADKGNYEIVKILISNGADVNLDSPLFGAAYNGHLQIAELLVSKGADVKQINSLFGAVENGHLEIVQLLISKGADVNVKNYQHETILHIATRKGHLNIAEFILSKGGDINAKNNYNITPLCLAAKQGHLQLVKFLISKGADINTLDDSGKSLLHFAAESGSIETIRFVIALGFKIDTKTKCIEVAEFEWREPNNFFEKTAIFFLSPFFSIPKNKLSIGNITPLHIAVQSGHLESVKFLVSNGANIFQRDDDGNTPLHFLGYHNRELIEEFLLKSGARVDVANNYLVYPYGFNIRKSDLREIGQILRKARPNEPIKCDYSDGALKFNKIVNKYFELYNDCLRYDVSDNETGRTSKNTTGDYIYSFKSAIKTIEKIAKFRNPIATNILYLLTKIEDITVTLNWICDNPGTKGNLSYKPIRDKALDILKKRGYPPVDPDAFLDFSSYKIRKTIISRIFHIF